MEVVLNDVGEMAKRFWKGVPAHFPNVSLDRYVIMPNHIHGIVIINHKNKFESVGTCHGMSLPSIRDGSVGPRHGVALHDDGESEHQIQKCQNQFSKPIPESLSVIINQYKAAVKSGCNKNGHADFYWQPRFYDHYNKWSWWIYGYQGLYCCKSCQLGKGWPS